LLGRISPPTEPNREDAETTGVITLMFHDEPPPRLAIAGDATMTGAGAPRAQNAGDTANDDHYAAARFRPSRRSRYLLQGPQNRQASLLDEERKSASVRSSARRFSSWR
jgi:hypothetical protein